MKKNFLTYIALFLLFIGTSVSAQETVDERGDVPNNDPVSEWFYDPRNVPEGGSFSSQTSLTPDQLVPIGTQNGAGSVGTPQQSIAGLGEWFMKILGYAVQLILALSLISFLYGIFRLVFLDASNEEARNKARKFMLWGICALFVMVSVWGLVNVLRSSFFGSSGGLTLPGFK